MRQSWSNIDSLSSRLLPSGFTGKEELTIKGVANDFGLEAGFLQQPDPVYACEEPARMCVMLDLRAYPLLVKDRQTR